MLPFIMIHKFTIYFNELQTNKLILKLMERKNCFHLIFNNFIKQDFFRRKKFLCNLFKETHIKLI
jgi:hypothetical protein